MIGFFLFFSWMDDGTDTEFQRKMEGNKYAYNFVYLIKKFPLKIGRI